MTWADLHPPTLGLTSAIAGTSIFLMQARSQHQLLSLAFVLFASSSCVIEPDEGDVNNDLSSDITLERQRNCYHSACTDAVDHQAVDSLPDPSALANPALSGAFVYLGDPYSGADPLPTTDIPRFVSDLAALGFDTLVVSHTRQKNPLAGCGGTAASFQWLPGLPDKLGVLLAQADIWGMKVYIGTTLVADQDDDNPQLGCATYYSQPNRGLVLQDHSLNMSYITLAYGSLPAFAGWYISNEPNIRASNYQSRIGYYSDIVNLLDSFTPGKPVGVSPYLKNALSPSEMALRAEVFRNGTGIDIQMWQDSVEASSVKLFPSWIRSGYLVDQYYSALAAKLGSGLWADLEISNYGKTADGDDIFGTSGGYRPASLMRINQQIWASRHAARRIAWLPQIHFDSVISPFPEADRLRQALRAYLGFGGSVLSWSRPYFWTTPPSPSYPDNISGQGAGKLTDTRTGDPTDYHDPTWVGVVGDTEIWINLGATTPVDWVAVHVLQMPVPAIFAPTAIRVTCDFSSSQVVTTQRPAFMPVPVVGKEEYVLGNISPLNFAGCSWLTVKLFNPNGWTFISEVEVTRD